MVATMGETACTICFPTAPTMTGFGDGSSYVAKLSAAEQYDKDAAKAAKAAAKAAKAIDDAYEIGERSPRKIRTLRAAQNELGQALEYVGMGYGTFIGARDEILVLAEAIAAKLGTSRDDVFSAAIPKANAKLRKHNRNRLHNNHPDFDEMDLADWLA